MFYLMYYFEGEGGHRSRCPKTKQLDQNIRYFYLLCGKCIEFTNCCWKNMILGGYYLNLCQTSFLGNQ